MLKGQIIGGGFSEIIIRKKANVNIEIGELLICENPKAPGNKILLQVYDLQYSSQISKQNLEMISGMKLEEELDADFEETELRNYVLAFAKPILSISKRINSSKSLPDFFGNVRSVTKDDFKFLSKPEKSIFLGNLRSGDIENSIDRTEEFVPIFLDGEKVFSHHVLVTGSTGKGKSVLMKNLLWDAAQKDYLSLLVLDPHDEYYGKEGYGLKDNKDAKIIYYGARNVPVGARTLKINLKTIRPDNLSFLGLSSPQIQAMNAYYREYKTGWIEAVILEKPIKVSFDGGSISVLKRRLLYLLDLDFDENQLFCNGIFSINSGETTSNDICSELERGNTVIIDTSSFSGQAELLIGSLIASEILDRYKRYKILGELKQKPVINIVLEEAPRVLGKEVIENGRNIFETIAREGRKFKVGLTAITQMPSLIPRDILANMNTKIILGTEMNTERQALIESASQDLSSDNRNLASLNKGEALVTSNFSSFAIPIRIPFFDEEVRKIITERTDTRNNDRRAEKPKINFSGIKIE